MTEIRNPKQLEDWLRDKPPIVAQAIAARVLFRTLPTLEPHLNSPESVLLYFRALYVMWMACRFPGRVTRATILQTLESIEFLTRDGDREFQNYRSEEAYAHAADAALRMVLRRALQTHLYMGTSYVGNAADAFSYARDAASENIDEISIEIENDISWLESNDQYEIQDLIPTLVSGGFWSPTGRLRGVWLGLKERLRPDAPDLAVWFGWFDFRAAGTPSIFGLDTSFDMPLAETIVNEEPAFWQGEADAVCQRIAEQIEAARTAQAERKANENNIPPQRSAPVVTRILDGKIIMADRPESTGKRPVFIAHVRFGLLDSLDDFVAAFPSHNHVQLRQVFSRIRDALGSGADTIDGIRLGVAAERLQALAMKADDIFMPEMASEVNALSRTVKTALGHLGEWSAFKGTVATDPVIADAAIVEAIEVVGALARTEIVATDVTEELKAEASALVTSDGVDGTKTERSAFIRGVSNLLSSLSELVSAGWDGFTSRVSKGVGDGVQEAAKGATLLGILAFSDRLLALAGFAPQWFGWLIFFVSYLKSKTK